MAILESKDASDMRDNDCDVQDLDRNIGRQETERTTPVDTDYDDDKYTSDSEAEIVVKSRETPTSTSILWTAHRSQKSFLSLRHLIERFR